MRVNLIVCYFVLCVLFILTYPAKSTNQNEILHERFNNRLEVLKYAMESIINHIEILEFKTEKLLKPVIGGDKVTSGVVCDNENQKLIQTFFNDTELIKRNQNDIKNIFNNLQEELKKNFNKKEIETSKKANDDDHNDNESTAGEVATKVEINDLKETLNEVLNKQISLETVFQLILESSEKNSTAEFIKAQFDDLKIFIKNERNVNDTKQLHDKNLNCLQNCNDTLKIFNSCQSALASNALVEGVYLLKIPNSDLKPFYAYCNNYDGIDWLIIQRREDGTENFYRNWNDYKKGFGNAFGEYWIGLERLHAMTKKTPLEVVIVLEDYSNHGPLLAKYTGFLVGSEEEGFALKFDKFEQNTSNASDALAYHNGMKFSTYDRDNDMSAINCARRFKGAWWYKACYQSNLNGRYFTYSDNALLFGINWGETGHSKRFVYMAVRS